METKETLVRRSSLAVKLSIIVLLSTAVIFFSAFGVTYFSVRSMLLKHAETEAGKLAEATQQRIQATLMSAMGSAVPLRALFQDTVPSETELFRLLDYTVLNSDVIEGAAVAFTPYFRTDDELYYAPYSYLKEGELFQSNLGGEDFDYFVRDWYQIPRQTGLSFWTDPFLAEGGMGKLISTYAAPLYLEDRFIGILAFDITLDKLIEVIEEATVFDGGFAFLTSSTGSFITYPNPEWIKKESFFSLAEEWDLPELRTIGREIIIEDAERFQRLPDRFLGEPAWIYHLPIPAAEWNISIVVPERVLYADVMELYHLILIISISGFAILLFVIIYVSKSITSPLKKLAFTAGQIAKGNLDEKLPSSRSQDEVGDLTRSFDNMRVALKDYIEDLTETTKAKERIESELKIARNIQHSFLPKRYALPAAVAESVDLYADLLAARHVGGDLYDFFVVQDRYLYFSVGDVADKGVPAALFMAVTKTLFKGIAEQYHQPEDILHKVNNELCINNDSGMFVTYLCGLLDLHTGIVKLANAGHNLPLIRHEDGSVEWLHLEPGLVLGAIEDAPVSVREIQLQPGDTLLLYTDGVVEAVNAEGELYGNPKLENELHRLGQSHPETVVRSIFKSVENFAGAAEQADDITVLSLRFKKHS